MKQTPRFIPALLLAAGLALAGAVTVLEKRNPKLATFLEVPGEENLLVIERRIRVLPTEYQVRIARRTENFHPEPARQC